MMNIWLEGEHIYKYVLEERYLYIEIFYGISMEIFWDKHERFGTKIWGMAQHI